MGSEGKLLIFARWNEMPEEDVSISVDWSVIDADIKEFAESGEKNVSVMLNGMKKESLASGLRRRIKTMKLANVKVVAVREGTGAERKVTEVWLVNAVPTVLKMVEKTTRGKKAIAVVA